MSDEAIRPALTPEEWAWGDVSWHSAEDGWPTSYSATLKDGGVELDDECHRIPTEGRHALAALCLVGQPFGFTRADVVRLRSSARMLRESLALQGSVGTWDFPQDEIASKRRHVEWYESLADRIEALLPPEGA